MNVLIIFRYLTDSWSDTDKHFPGDSWDDVGNNLYGCLKQLYLLKTQNRNLKVLLSVGGWTYSSNFVMPASTASGRSNFASSVVSLVKNLGFDGVDIDWEYPADDSQSANIILLLQAIRDALDSYGESLSSLYHFILTVACPAGPSNYQKLQLSEMDQYVDFWNLMAYDYAGSWSAVTGNQANLFASTSNAASTPFDTDTAVEYYISQGIAADKILLGMPVYGRSFESTAGLGMPFNGIGQGTWEAGVYDYKALPLSGATEVYDDITGSSYSHDSLKKELISYDNIAVALQKAEWVQTTGLGGAMWWETSADIVGNLSLISNVAGILRGQNGEGLESTLNQIMYPDSTYDNLRAGMIGSGSTNPSSTSASTISSSTLLLGPTTSESLSTSVTITLGPSAGKDIAFTQTTTTLSSSIPTSQCSLENPCSGDLTFFTAGLGACGQTTDGDTESVIALPYELMGTKSNDNPYCNRSVTIEKDGKKIEATVVDKCMGCVGYSIDLSNKAFSSLGIDFSVGRTKGTWFFNN